MTTYPPTGSSRTGYEHTGSTVSSRETGSGLDAGDRNPGGSTPGAGWAVDDATQPGDTTATDTRLFEQPGGGAGATGSMTGGSAASGSGTFDPDSLADADRTDAVTGGDASRFTGRSGEERS